jgi:hypothetical protein
MKLLKRKWMDYEIPKKIYDPDTILAKQLAWKRGQNNIATSSYPEPCNIIAASAWPKMIPKEAEAQAYILYKCGSSGLWIQCISTEEYTHEQAEVWLDQQLSMGAVNAWSNADAIQPRYQPTIIDVEDEEFTNILRFRGTYTIGDIDILGSTSSHFANKPARVYRFGGKEKRGVKKPILTPKGIFPSVALASKEFDLTSNSIAVMARGNRNGFRYLSKDELEQYNQDPAL